MSDDLNPQPLPPMPKSESTPEPQQAPFQAAQSQQSARQPPAGYQPPRPVYPTPPQNPAPYPPQYSGPYAAATFYTPSKPRSPWFWPAILFTCFAILGFLFWGLVYTVMRASDDSSTSTSFGSSRIAVIDLAGVIVDADKIDAQLRKYGDDDSVKGIILHINSPGGGAAASQEIYHEVVRIRQEKHKKIVASVESVGASGAYYIASGCDKIYANDASVVGSIGVIMEWTNYGDLYRWAKLKSVVIHAGELKDAGDPTHDMTPKEAAYFQSLVDNMYGQFIQDVADGRHTSADKIKSLATGQVWTGQQSLPLGLVDKVGGYRVALIDTARSVGIKDEPTVIRPASAKRGLSALINGDADSLFPNPTKMLDRSPGFYFMWK
jgi:protease-4